MTAEEFKKKHCVKLSIRGNSAGWVPDKDMIKAFDTMLAFEKKQAASEAWNAGINTYQNCVSPIEKAKQQYLKKYDTKQ